MSATAHSNPARIEIAPVNSASCRRFLPWLGLLSICAAFVIAVVRVHPTNFFGYGGDDSIYLSSAKALAEGKGYVLPSFPGTPAATKYPKFYPWILSWIWRWNPSFPANVRDALGVTLAFGLLYVAVIFIFMRGLKGIGEVEALILTAFCALHPRTIFYSSQLITDIPFAGLTLLALILAENGSRNRGRLGDAACCGIVMGFALLFRVLGVPIAAGIAVAFALRRAWRQLGVFCACLASFFAVLASGTIFRPVSISPTGAASASTPAWAQTWAYYTNYLNVWKAAVPNASTFFARMQVDAFWLVRAPADFFAWPWPSAQTSAGEVAAIVITLVIVKGILRLTRESTAKSIRWSLALYSITILFWVFVEGGRFFLPFLPVFAAGLWIEAKYLARAVNTALTTAAPASEKFAATAFGLLIVVSILAGSMDYLFGLRSEVADLSASRAAILPEKIEAYEWLTRSTDKNARVIAVSDGVLFLYTGRSAVRPIVFTGPQFYHSAKLGSVPESVTEVARVIGASYFLVSDDDGEPDWQNSCAKELQGTPSGMISVVYTSPAGHVRICSFGCGDSSPNSSCEAANVPAGDNRIGRLDE